MKPRAYCVHVTEADLRAVARDKLGTSPLVRKLRRVFGSTARLDGPRLILKDKRTALVLDARAVEWQRRWAAGLRVGPAVLWLESVPTAVPTPPNFRAVRRDGA